LQEVVDYVKSKEYIDDILLAGDLNQAIGSNEI